VTVIVIEVAWPGLAVQMMAGSGVIFDPPRPEGRAQGMSHAVLSPLRLE
jgi:hypothetical protein